MPCVSLNHSSQAKFGGTGARTNYISLAAVAPAVDPNQTAAAAQPMPHCAFKWRP